MRTEVYVLTPLGRRALAGEVSTVPPQLRPLLGAIDGRRSREEVLALCGRSAVNAGGLTWLASAGYIERLTQMGASLSTLPGEAVTGLGRTGLSAMPEATDMSGMSTISPPPTVSAPPPPTAPRPAPPRPHTVPDPGPATSRRAPPTQPSLLPMHDALAGYMLETIRRYLREDADLHRRRVIHAASLTDLLPHVSPLIDAVLDAAGPQAAAEFADEAAAILQPDGR